MLQKAETPHTGSCHQTQQMTTCTDTQARKASLLTVVSQHAVNTTRTGAAMRMVTMGTIMSGGQDRWKALVVAREGTRQPGGWVR